MAFITKITSSINHLTNKLIPSTNSSKVTRGQSFTHDYINKNNLLHDFSLELSQNADLNDFMDNEKQENENKLSFLA